jgi:heme A synthase
MRRTYQVLAWLISGLVVVQAAAIAFAMAGVVHFVDGGGVIDKALVESEDMAFPEIAGFIIHGMNGGMLIPLVALVLMGVSFGAKFPGARKWAAIVLGLVALQVFLGYGLYGAAALGVLHGANALLVFGSSAYAGRLAAGEMRTDSDSADAMVSA